MTDPWGNPLPPEDQAPTHPQPEDYPPDFTPLPAAALPSVHSVSPPAWPGPPPPPPSSTPGAKFSGMAIAAMVCGILSITCMGFLGIILGPTALGLGLNARKSIHGSNGWKKGDGMATAGIVTGVIGIILSIVYLVFLLRNPNFITDFVNNLTTTTTSENLQGA
ncbi:MAG: DUF4190 domain-containing protein [Acidimicrobiales bacterium]